MKLNVSPAIGVNGHKCGLTGKESASLGNTFDHKLLTSSNLTVYELVVFSVLLCHFPSPEEMKHHGFSLGLWLIVFWFTLNFTCVLCHFHYSSASALVPPP